MSDRAASCAVFASDPDAFTAPWFERRAAAYADDARALVARVTEYEEVHPDDAPCLASLLRAVPGIAWRGHDRARDVTPKGDGHYIEPGNVTPNESPAVSLRLRYLTHGTPGGYIDGCRCWSCRLGWLSAGRAFRRLVKKGEGAA